MARTTLKAMLAITALCLRQSSTSFGAEGVKVDRTRTNEEESSLLEFLENHQLVEDVERMAAARGRLESSSVAANSYRIKESARQERAARQHRDQRDEEGLLKLEMEMLLEEREHDTNDEADMVWVDSVWDFEGVEDSDPVEGFFGEGKDFLRQSIRGGLRGRTDLR